MTDLEVAYIKKTGFKGKYNSPANFGHRPIMSAIFKVPYIYDEQFLNFTT